MQTTALSPIELAEEHSKFKSFVFYLKSNYHLTIRSFRNLLHPVDQHSFSDKLADHPVVGKSSSLLWTSTQNASNRLLTAGKIENLRIAAKQLNGLVIPANKTFSFWKQIGNPNFGKRYVVGREIKEGCLVPTIAGGLCQLSNALYDAALKANFEIIERHRHSKVIKGSLAEQDRDATVKWNYVDLRFRSSNSFRIEVELTATHLIVSFKCISKSLSPTQKLFIKQKSHALNDCYSCGNTACSKFVKVAPVPTNSTTYVLNMDRKEVNTYITKQITAADSVISTVPVGIKHPAANTTIVNNGIINRIKRLFNKEKNVFVQRQTELAHTAKRLAKEIPLTTTHLVVSQELLPYFLEFGVLGGRTYDVLMTRMPFEQLHKRLDYALQIHTQSTTLNDFRVENNLMTQENKGLNGAQKIVTTHQEIADLFPTKTVLLQFEIDQAGRVVRLPRKKLNILFPSSLLARKGALLLDQLPDISSFNLYVAGKAVEYDQLPQELNAKPFSGDLNEIDLIISPTYVDHYPILVVEGLRHNIPVITTPASGLDSALHPKLTIVPMGDTKVLKEAFSLRVGLLQQISQHQPLRDKNQRIA
jgi:hypothetical protein